MSDHGRPNFLGLNQHAFQKTEKKRQSVSRFAPELEFLESRTLLSGFDPLVTVPTQFRPRGLLAGDFNHDGKLDLVTANDAPANAVSVLLGHGNGVFDPPKNFNAGPTPYSLTSDDFNGDGNADLVMANYRSSDTVTVMLGNGNGTFGMPVSYAAGSFSNGVAIADFNNDGKKDLIVANVFQGQLSLLLGNGDGSFKAPMSKPYNGANPDQIACGDFNHDGKQDLAVTNFNFGTVSVLLGDGTGGFGAASSYTVGTLVSSVTTMDLNKDGTLDLIVASQGTSGDTVNVLIGNANGSFKPPISYAVGTDPVSTAVADLNGDGQADVIVGNAVSQSVSILFGNKDGTLQNARNVSTSGFAENITIADFNADGKVDLAMSDFSNSSIVLLLGNGDGSLAAPVSFRAHDTPGSVAVSDFDRDGKLDLAVANYISHDVSILRGNGDGTFSSAVNYVVDSGTNQVITGDFNGDGNLDLVTVNRDANDVSLLLGNGNGTFAAATNFSSGGSYPWSVATGDVNGDHKLDLVVDNQQSAAISVFLGNGNGTFATPIPSTLLPGSETTAIALADFNGDGKLDLVSANRFSNDVGILLGNGNGTFGPPTILPNSLVPEGVVSADINGDGNQDIITADLGFGVSVLLGNGDGTFAPVYHLPLVTIAGSLAVGDIDGDGKLDVITGDPGANRISVFYGNGNGVFSPSRDYAAGSLPESVAVGDFNRDGALDVVVPNNNTGTISVLLNKVAPITLPSNTTTGISGSVNATGITRIWSGASQFSNNWSDPSNWQGNIAPNPGDDLVFPEAAGQSTRVQNTNDFVAGTTFNSITFTGTHTKFDFYRGFSLSGNALTLNAGIIDKSDGVNTLGFDMIRLSTSQAITTGLDTLLWIVAPVNLNGFTLTLDGATQGDLRSTVSGAGNLIKNGNSIWNVWGNNTYTGLTTVNAGMLSIKSGTALGTTDGGTVVNSGATLDAGYIGFQSAEPLTLNGTGVNGSNGALRASPLDSLVKFTGPITLGSATTIFTAQISVGLTLSGLVSNQGFDLTLTGSLNTSVIGGISGSGRVTNSALVLAGVGSFGGPVQVTHGALTAGVGGPGLLATGNVVFQSGTSFQVNLSGNVPGANGYSQLNVQGSTDLAGANLVAALHYTPSSSDSFTILTCTGALNGLFNDPITNTLLNDGDTFVVGGQSYQIHYIRQSSASPGIQPAIRGQLRPASQVIITPIGARIIQASKTTLTLSAATITAGQSVTLTAEYSDVNGGNNIYLPLNPAQFMDGSRVITSVPFDSNGFATFLYQFPIVGFHTLTAMYPGGDANGDGLVASSTSTAMTLTVTPANTAPGSIAFATGSDVGSGAVNVFDAKLNLIKTLFPFDAPNQPFVGGIRVALADVNADGIPDIITAPGPGVGATVRIFNGSNFAPIGGTLSSFSVLGGFTGGVNVAAADINGDGHADIVVSADKGGPIEVQVISGINGLPLYDFSPFAASNQGVMGLRVATGDVDGDGRADIIIGTTTGSTIKIVRGRSGGQVQDIFGFTALDPAFNGGVYVAAGDLSSDGKADVVVGPGAGGGSTIVVFDGASLSRQVKTQISTATAYAAGDTNFALGVRVALYDSGKTGAANIVLCAGPGGSPDTKIFDAGGTFRLELYSLPSGFTGGEFVGGMVTPPRPAPLATPGLYDPTTSIFFIKNSLVSGAADASIAFGPPTQAGAPPNLPLIGDWKKTGKDDIGIYQQSSPTFISNTFFLHGINRTEYANDNQDIHLGPGAVIWDPVVGDWDGDGASNVGVYDPNTGHFFLKTSFTRFGIAEIGGASPGQITFYPDGAKTDGSRTLIPIGGDWDGDGIATVGLLDPKTSTFFLLNHNVDSPRADVTIQFGPAGLNWMPVVGNWSGQQSASGKPIDTIGLFDPVNERFYLRSANAGGIADTVVDFMGVRQGSQPFLGIAIAGGSPLRSAAMAVDSANSIRELTPAALQPIVHEALNRFESAGLSANLVQALSSVQFIITRLPINDLGLEFGTVFDRANAFVELDPTAAGFGWFVDPTPDQSEEFTESNSTQTALINGPASGKMDLLTVVMHELGHAAGLDDLDPLTHAGDLMAATLQTGQRRTPQTSDIDAIFASDAFAARWSNGEYRERGSHSRS